MKVDDDDTPPADLQLAAEMWATRERFDMFIVGLTFTVLGAAVQTAKFDAYSKSAQWLELVAWLLLLVTGLVGILRIYFLTTVVTLDKVHKDFALREKGLEKLRGESAGLRQEIEEQLVSGAIGSRPILARIGRNELKQASMAKTLSDEQTKIRTLTSTLRAAFAAAENAHVALILMSFTILGFARAHDPLGKLLGWS